ncbi:hypothetical protein ACE0DR_28885 [Azotobacter sp. CWF10]
MNWRSRWRPILDTCGDSGINLCYEVHPSEDLHDGAFSFPSASSSASSQLRALPHPVPVPNHFVLQQLDYLECLDIYHPLIPHVPRQGCGVPAPSGRGHLWRTCPTGPSAQVAAAQLGDGQVDFRSIFSSWRSDDLRAGQRAGMGCCLKVREAGAREGASRVHRRPHRFPVTDKIFDGFAGAPIQPPHRCSGCSALPEPQRAFR